MGDGNSCTTPPSTDPPTGSPRVDQATYKCIGRGLVVGLCIGMLAPLILWAIWTRTRGLMEPENVDERLLLLFLFAVPCGGFVFAGTGLGAMRWTRQHRKSFFPEVFLVLLGVGVVVFLTTPSILVAFYRWMGIRGGIKAPDLILAAVGIQNAVIAGIVACRVARGFPLNRLADAPGEKGSRGAISGKRNIEAECEQ